MEQLPRHVARAVDRFLARAAAAPGGGVERVVLFGSHARGDFRGDSDVDLLVVVPRRDPELLEWLYDAVLDGEIEEGVRLSLKVVPERTMAGMISRGTPLTEAIARDGKTLWTRASSNVSAAT